LGSRAILGIRANKLRLEDREHAGSLAVVIVGTERHLQGAYVICDAAHGQVVVQIGSDHLPQAGEKRWLMPEDSGILFEAGTGRTLIEEAPQGTDSRAEITGAMQ
jgi:hypothetical protein